MMPQSQYSANLQHLGEWRKCGRANQHDVNRRERHLIKANGENNISNQLNTASFTRKKCWV